MLIVAGTIDVEPARREEYLASRKEAILRSRGEKGCIEYSFAADSLDPGRVRLFEIWASSEDLEAHRVTMRTAQASSPTIQVLARDITEYGITSTEPTANPQTAR
jgi:quinol monooxygenase YgiN